MRSAQIIRWAELFESLPSLATRPLADRRRQDVKKVAEELRRVRFEWPEGFDGDECRFWVGGLDGRASRLAHEETRA